MANSPLKEESSSMDSKGPTANAASTERVASEQVRAQLEQDMRSGRWREGEQLPTERDMCEQYGAARNTVRRALQSLEAAGLIVRQIGRGTFRTSTGHPQSAEIQQQSNFSPADVVEARLLLEPPMLALGVARATRADLDHLHHCLKAGDAAMDLASFEHWDAEFHDALAVATHNSTIIALSRLLAQTRRDTEWGQLKGEGATPERMAQLKQHHHAIFDAFVCRDKVRASRAMHDHLKFVQNYMFGN